MEVDVRRIQVTVLGGGVGQGRLSHWHRGWRAL